MGLKKLISDQSGITLLEVLMASSIILPMLMWMLSASLYNVRTNQDTAFKAQVTQCVLEFQTRYNDSEVLKQKYSIGTNAEDQLFQKIDECPIDGGILEFAGSTLYPAAFGFGSLDPQGPVERFFAWLDGIEVLPNAHALAFPPGQYFLTYAASFVPHVVNGEAWDRWQRLTGGIPKVATPASMPLVTIDVNRNLGEVVSQTWVMDLQDQVPTFRAVSLNIFDGTYDTILGCPTPMVPVTCYQPSTDILARTCRNGPDSPAVACGNIGADWFVHGATAQGNTSCVVDADCDIAAPPASPSLPGTSEEFAGATGFCDAGATNKCDANFPAPLPAIGACTLGTDCTITTQSNCAALSGAYEGDGTGAADCGGATAGKCEFEGGAVCSEDYNGASCAGTGGEWTAGSVCT